MTKYYCVNGQNNLLDFLLNMRLKISWKLFKFGQIRYWITLVGFSVSLVLFSFFIFLFSNIGTNCNSLSHFLAKINVIFTTKDQFAIFFFWAKNQCALLLEQNWTLMFAITVIDFAKPTNLLRENGWLFGLLSALNWFVEWNKLHP